MLQQFALKFTDEAEKQLNALGKDKALERRYKAVRKALGFMQVNLRHPSLNTHEYETLTKIMGEKVFEAYAETNTPDAYRIFWKYGPSKDEITIISITAHP